MPKGARRNGIFSRTGASTTSGVESSANWSARVSLFTNSFCDAVGPLWDRRDRVDYGLVLFLVGLKDVELW